MTGRFEVFDPRPGGVYRMSLSYEDSSLTGKSGGGSDVVDRRFVELTPNVRVVQSDVFDSGDPAFAGTMTMTWELRPVDGGTEVIVLADDVPEGISAEDHLPGMNASLENLASFIQVPSGARPRDAASDVRAGARSLQGSTVGSDFARKGRAAGTAEFGASKLPGQPGDRLAFSTSGRPANRVVHSREHEPRLGLPPDVMSGGKRDLFPPLTARCRL